MRFLVVFVGFFLGLPGVLYGFAARRRRASRVQSYRRHVNGVQRAPCRVRYLYASRVRGGKGGGTMCRVGPIHSRRVFGYFFPIVFPTRCYEGHGRYGPSYRGPTPNQSRGHLGYHSYGVQANRRVPNDVNRTGSAKENGHGSYGHASGGHVPRNSHRVSVSLARQIVHHYDHYHGYHESRANFIKGCASYRAVARYVRRKDSGHSTRATTCHFCQGYRLGGRRGTYQRVQGVSSGSGGTASRVGGHRRQGSRQEGL